MTGMIIAAIGSRISADVCDRAKVSVWVPLPSLGILGAVGLKML